MSDEQEWAVLDRTALDAITSLVERTLPDEHLQASELERALFAVDQPAIVRGDPEVAVVAAVHAIDDPTQGFVRLLVVDPEHRRAGVGRSLLAAAEADLGRGGARSVRVGADAPYYLFAGAPAEQTGLLCLLERMRYERREANLNMAIDLHRLAPDPGTATVADGGDGSDLEALLAGGYGMWAKEVRRALAQQTLVVLREADGGLVGFCAYDVNRRGLLGPAAVRPDLIGQGRGKPMVLAALHRMRDAGASMAEVSWVGPIRPYAAVGGSISRVFLVYRKELVP